jgi:DNA-binding winged helix-turn-helix (wHTH) protein
LSSLDVRSAHHFILALPFTPSDCFNFGSWCWQRHEQVLLRAGRPVALGSRAREILALLLEEPGALVTNERIVAQVWRGTFVVKVAVRVHIAQLRRVLREDLTCYVENVRGIGYRIAVPSPQSLAFPGTLDRDRENDAIGRSSIIDSVLDCLAHSRLVTIAGPRGVGASFAAMPAARSPGNDEMDVRVADLLGTNSAATQAVAAVLGSEASVDRSLSGECVTIRRSGSPARAATRHSGGHCFNTCCRCCDVMSMTDGNALQFGPFRWLPGRGLLLKSGEPVRMSPRVAAILSLLLERPGVLVLKKEIRRRIWPTTTVRDATLRGHILALRKVLQAGLPGPDCVQNVVGYGYRFVLPMSGSGGPAGDALQVKDDLPGTPTRVAHDS